MSDICCCACETRTTKGYRVSDGARVSWEYCPECGGVGDMVDVGGYITDTDRPEEQ